MMAADLEAASVPDISHPAVSPTWPTTCVNPMVPAPGASSSVAPPSKWIDGLTPEVPFPEALECILHHRWKGVQQSTDAALHRSHDDTEHVHRLRVACRRLGAILQTVGKDLSRKVCRNVLKLLKRIRRRCGDARDLDVQLSFIESLLPHLPSESAIGVGIIREQLLRRRGKVQKKLEPRLARLAEKLAGVEDKLFRALKRVQEAASSDQTFGSRCAGMLELELARFWEQAGNEHPEAEALHALRIACKNLRYTAEVTAPVLSDAFREEFYPQLKKVQTQLGNWNDSVVAEKSLSRLRKKCKRRCDGHGQCVLAGKEPVSWRELEEAFATLGDAYRQKGERALQEFRQTWPEFSGAHFRLPVQDLLTSARERESLEQPLAKKRAAQEFPEQEPVGV